MFTGKDIKGIRKKFYESQAEIWKKMKKKPEKWNEKRFTLFAKEIEKASGIQGKLSGFTVLNWERSPNKSVPKKWWKGLQKLGEQLFEEGPKHTEDEKKVKSEFLDKLKQSLKDISRELLIKAVSLFLYAQSSKVTTTDKVMIYGTLAYFIIPIDAIPDFTPIIGYSDDLAMILATINKVLGTVAKKYERKAKEWLNDNGIFIKD